MIHIKYLAVNIHHKSVVRTLVGHARNVAYDLGYSFVSIGLHEKDPLNKLLPGSLKFIFLSEGMLLSLKNDRGLISAVKEGIPFEDYSLV
jgi:hypothetical protein